MIAIGTRRKHDVAFTNLEQDVLKRHRSALADVETWLERPHMEVWEREQLHDMRDALRGSIDKTGARLAAAAKRMPLFYRMQYYIWRACNWRGMP